MSTTVLDLIDTSAPTFGEEEWDSEFAIDSSTLIRQANDSFSLLEYLESHYSLEFLGSVTGWTRKMQCPFHKHGNERTPSFFINEKSNRYLCHACGATGGLVQFISFKFNRPESDVATHLLKLSKQGLNAVAIIESQKKIDQKKKVVGLLLELSDIFREFIHAHADDDIAIRHVNKIMEGFDTAYLLNPEGVEKNITEVVGNLRTLLSNYDRK